MITHFLRLLRTFAEFENGFGVVSKEHWLGVKYQHIMTKGKSCTFMALLDVDLGSQANKGSSKCGKYPADCDGKVRL